MSCGAGRPGVALRLAAALLLAVAMPAAAQKEGQPVVILGGNLIDGTGAGAVPNAGIEIANGKFLGVGRPPTAQEQAGARIVRLPDDEYILPGLIDVHAHYNVRLVGRRRVDDTLANPLIFLANGVTTTWPAGEYDPEPMMRLRQRIDAGLQIGPRIFNSGPYFGTARPGWDPNMPDDSLRREVDYWAAHGVRAFKAKGLDPEHMRVLIDEAHLHDLPVAGHLDSGFRNTVNASDAIRLGIDRVEHILGGPTLTPDRGAYSRWIRVDTTSPEFHEIVRLFLSHHTFFDPTITAPVYFTRTDDKPGFDHWVDETKFFTPWVQARVRARPPRHYNPLMDSLYWAMRRSTKAFYDAGGGNLLTLGTDNPSTGDYLAGFSAHRELQTLVSIGIPPAAAIRIATLNGATALGAGQYLGSIETGKFADLFVVRGDPLDDIRNTRNVLLVMKAGRIYDPAVLLKQAEGRIGPASEQEAADW